MPDQIQGAYRDQMNRIAAVLDRSFNGDTLPKKVAFVLLTAEFDQIKDGRVNYISNAERSDIIAMMKETIARFEGRYAEDGGNG